MWEVYGTMTFVVIGLSSLWVKGITDMHEKYPEYKGDEGIGGFDFDDQQEKDENRKDYDED